MTKVILFKNRDIFQKKLNESDETQNIANAIAAKENKILMIKKQAEQRKQNIDRQTLQQIQQIQAEIVQLNSKLSAAGQPQDPTKTPGESATQTNPATGQDSPTAGVAAAK